MKTLQLLEIAANFEPRYNENIEVFFITKGASMKLKKIIIAIAGGGLLLFLAPKTVFSEGASDLEVTSAVQAQVGECTVNHVYTSPTRVEEKWEHGEGGFQKAFEVNTSSGRVAIFRDKQGIYWHFSGGQNNLNVSGQGGIRGIFTAPGAPEISTALMYAIGLLIGGRYFRRKK